MLPFFNYRAIHDYFTLKEVAPIHLFNTVAVTGVAAIPAPYHFSIR